MVDKLNMLKGGNPHIAVEISRTKNYMNSLESIIKIIMLEACYIKGGNAHIAVKILNIIYLFYMLYTCHTLLIY